MNSKTLNKLGILKKGKLKGQICLILSESHYINSDNLKWCTIYVNKHILSIQKENLNFI